MGKDGTIWSGHGNEPYAISPKATKFGPRVRLSVNGRAKYCYVAVIVAETWIGPRGHGQIIGFRDGQRGNVAAANLFWTDPPAQVSAVDFVLAWQASETVREVAERLGITYELAQATSKTMREHGVPLKQIVATKKDWAALAELARKSESEAQRQ